MSEMGVVMWPEPRRDKSHLAMKRFPVLGSQARCSTGFTHAPGGVLRLPAGAGTGRVLPIDVPTPTAEPNVRRVGKARKARQ